MEKLFIPVLLGTARKGRQSEKAARFVLQEVKKYGLKTELVDVKNFAMARTVPSWEKNSTADKWRAIVKKSDGLIIVSPEYNHGYPGELKIVLDYAYAEYEKKPAAVCGVSRGDLGGARMVEQLRQVLIELKMKPAREAVYFARDEELFDKNGKIKDASYADRVKKMLDELVFYAKVLKVAG